eukprot:XP_001700184.1 predicted protein [Chlamydomonas reinhardtii]
MEWEADDFGQMGNSSQARNPDSGRSCILSSGTPGQVDLLIRLEARGKYALARNPGVPDFFGADLNGTTTGPDFVLVGAQKTGTTSLYQHLMKNPYLASVGGPDQKDTHYFSGTGSKYDKSSLCDNEVEPYLRLTAAARRQQRRHGATTVITPQLVGDFSPTHLTCICCAASLRMANPSMKVLVLLRDPVSRALSRFLEFKTQRHLADYYPDALELSSHTFVSYVEAELAHMRRCTDTARRFRAPASSSSILGWSAYDIFLENYAAQFGWRQIKVLYTHDLLTSPGATLRAVEDFLGAPRARLDPNDKLDTLVYTRDCYSDNCPKRRRELRPLTESAAAGVGGAAGADAAAGSGGSDATAAGTGSTISRSPFGRAVTALRQFYAPHMQQLFRWADQGVIPQPPQAWRDARAPYDAMNLPPHKSTPRPPPPPVPAMQRRPP